MRLPTARRSIAFGFHEALTMLDLSSLAGRSVIVTGGSRGLGRETALTLLEAGARVAITATGESPQLAETVKAAEAVGRRRFLSIVGDVRRQEDCERVAREVLAAFGSIQVLFNNAALGMPTIIDADKNLAPPFWRIEPKTWTDLIDTNINGVFLMTRAAVPAMLAQGFGKIVNLTTNGRTMIRKQGSPYGPSKVFIEAASRVWAQDLKDTGVTVNALLPGGAIDTSPTMVLARGGTFMPITIMRAPVLWLASDLSNGHTGERFTAKLWNEDLPLDERIAAARDEPIELPRIM
jgi:3-oxoacyl-[acyl-carrier protein] reductase